MSEIRASDGTVVTDAMIDEICAALDRDEWPEGWKNVGPVVRGGTTEGNSETVTVKVTPAMKMAIEREAKTEGVAVSAYVRGAIERTLMSV